MPTCDSEMRLCPICHNTVPYDICYLVFTSPGCGTNEGRLDVCPRCANNAFRWDPVDVNCGTEGRAFGVEIETSSCREYLRLKGKTCFGAKIDGSISGMEFCSPILRGSCGLTEVRRFLNRANRRRFKVNSDCGLHVHIDMQDLTALQKRKVAYAFVQTQAVWQSLVTEYRAHDCTFCRPTNFTHTEVRGCRHFGLFARLQDRYYWLNLRAIGKFGTIEIRHHQATLDSNEVCNWIVALVRFVDAVKDMKYSKLDEMFLSIPTIQYYWIKQLWGSKKLSRFYNSRTRLNINRLAENRLRCAQFNRSRRLVSV